MEKRPYPFAKPFALDMIESRTQLVRHSGGSPTSVTSAQLEEVNRWLAKHGFESVPTDLYNIFDPSPPKKGKK